ncbi:MAG: AtpZ/AtpI family protein [Chloroflexi bacterium]|nr:MAG: AtpZ/AtpI family protein [Chloroflexota bacterium]
MLDSPRPQPPKKGASPAIWTSPAVGFVGIGSYLATSIVGLTLIGRWLDGKFELSPVLTLVFLAFGLLVGFYGAYRQLRDVLAIQATRRQGRDERG